MFAQQSATASGAQFACHCLNVSISPRRPSPDAAAGSSAPPSQPDFTTQFVGSEGIRVMYPRATLKSRSEPTLVNKTRIEWIKVTCLFCRHLVYQIRTENFTHTESIPSNVKQWVDHVVFKSVSGWIQIHNACLTGDAIVRVTQSPEYSPHMSIFVSRESQALATPIRVSPVPSSIIEFRKSLLPDFPQFMPPPALISQHPAFSQLAAQAMTASQAARVRAEQKVLQAAKDALHDLDEEEERIRDDLSLLWYNFKKGHKEQVSSTEPSQLAGGAPLTPTTPSSSLDQRAFAPRPITQMASSLPARPSALSQSLQRQRMFYQPPQPLPSPPSSSSSTLVAPPPGPELDQAASYRWTQEALEQARIKAAASGATRPSQPVPQPAEQVSPPRKRVQSVPTGSAFRTRSPDPEVEERKGKRKVTFDATPKVVTFGQGPTRPGASGRLQRSNSADEALFELDMADLVEDAQTMKEPPSPILTKEVKLPRAKHSPLRSGAPPVWSSFAQLTSSLPTRPEGMEYDFPDLPMSMRTSTFTLPPTTSPGTVASTSSGSSSGSNITVTPARLSVPQVNGKGKGKARARTGEETPSLTSEDASSDDSEWEEELAQLRQEAEELASSLPRSSPVPAQTLWSLGQRSFAPLASVAETPADLATLTDFETSETADITWTTTTEYTQQVDQMIRNVEAGGAEELPAPGPQALGFTVAQVREEEPVEEPLSQTYKEREMIRQRLEAERGYGDHQASKEGEGPREQRPQQEERHSSSHLTAGRPRRQAS